MAAAATSTAGGDGDGDDEWEICNEDGFVYKRRRVLHPPDDADAATSYAPGQPPEAVLRRRRRQALLRLRARYLDELSRWESLSSDVLAPLPAAPAAALPPRPPSDPVAASPPPGSSSSSSSDLTVIDGLLAQAEVTEQLLKRLTEVCDEIDEFCRAHEAAFVDAITDLPVWGDPRELMNSLCSPTELPICGDPRELMNSLCSPGKKAVSGTD